VGERERERETERQIERERERERGLYDYLFIYRNISGMSHRTLMPLAKFGVAGMAIFSYYFLEILNFVIFKDQ
jgi:hypothetical protein